MAPAPSSPTWASILHLGAFYASWGHSPHCRGTSSRACRLTSCREAWLISIVPLNNSGGFHWHYHFRSSHRWGSCVVGPR